MGKYTSDRIVPFLEEKKGKTTKLGHFTCTIDEEAKMSIFYLVENQDKTGKPYYSIYTVHNGRLKELAKVGMDNKVFRIAGDVNALNIPSIERQIALLNQHKLETGEEPGGDGRSLGASEHKVQTQTAQNRVHKDNVQNDLINAGFKENEEKKSAKLKNLREEGISKENRPLVRLNTIINGYYLWKILGIEEKLKGRLPEGVDETSFRNGYLTIFDSEELRNNGNNDLKDEKETTKDGGLEYKDKFAICTSDGNYIIELDETILKPKDRGTKDEQIRAQQSALKQRDGKKVGTFKSQEDLTYTDITGIALYEIPNVYDRFRAQESWTLSINRNLVKERGINIDSTQYRKEITFGQQSLGETTYDRERNYNTLQTKLEPISEEPYQDKAEEKQQRGLERFDENEAMNARNHSFKVLANKCRTKYSVEKLEETFGNNLEKFIENKKNEGLSDIDVMKEVGWKLGEVDKGRTIYDDHIPGERRRF